MRVYFCPATNVGINRSPEKINPVVKAQRFTSTVQSKILVTPLYSFSRYFFRKPHPISFLSVSSSPSPSLPSLIHSRFRSRFSLLMSPSIPLLHGNPQLRHQSNRHSPSSQCRPASGQTRPSPCSTTHTSSSLPRLLLLLLLPRGGPHPPPCYCRTPRSASTGPEAPFLASASCLCGFTGAFLRASISASLSFESVRPWSEGLSERDGTGRRRGGRMCR